MNKPLDRSNLLTFYRVGEHLVLEPTPEGVDTAKECLLTREEADNHRSPNDQLFDMIECFLCNGWQTVPPEHIGALTDAPIISQDGTLDDDGRWVPATTPARVYAHMNYCVEDPVETWANGKSVTFQGSELVPA